MLLGQLWWLMVSWSRTLHSSAEVNWKGLSCSEVCVYLLSISLRKSYVELSVPAGLHQVSRSNWTGLVRNESDRFVLKKPIRGVLTKPIRHGHSWPERTSEPEPNQWKAEGIDFRAWSVMQVTPCLADSPPQLVLHCWAKPERDLLSGPQGWLFCLRVARRKATPWFCDQWEGPAALALLEGVWKPCLAESLVAEWHTLWGLPLPQAFL